MNYKDIAERATVTFAQAFLATFVVTDLASGKSAALAGASALLSLLKSVVASQYGDRSPNALS
tara:strand:+ start:6901 stop:7089 length:189 start_codon:yes stop_codon:yes gene_type:complete